MIAGQTGTTEEIAPGSAAVPDFDQLTLQSEAMLALLGPRDPYPTLRTTPALERLLGYPRAVFGADPSFFGGLRIDDAGARRELDRSNPEGVAEYRLKRSDGSEVHVREEWRHVDFDGRHPLILSTFTDVSAIRASEAALARESRRLSYAKRDIEQFAHVASHDLRAPLLAVGTLAEWIQTDLGEALQGEGKEQMRLLRGRVQRMDRLLSDLLEYAKVGRVKIAPEPVDVRGLVRELIDLAGLEHELSVEFRGDEGRLLTAVLPLKRVLIGILSNSAKHHDRLPGHVVVERHSEGEFDVFTVTDDGPGIPLEFYDRVFDMFQTLKPRDANEGSGMGLALVRRIIEWAGGQVSLASPGDRGLSVRFTWPKAWKAVPTGSGSVPRVAIARPAAGTEFRKDGKRS